MTLFTDEEIRLQVSRRDRWRYLALALALLVGSVAFGVLIVARDAIISWCELTFSKNISDLAPAMMVLVGSFGFMLPLLVVGRRAYLIKLRCPYCQADFGAQTKRVLGTRCCPCCGERIVEGEKVRSEKAWVRFTTFRWRRHLSYWLWSWPILGVVILGIYTFDAKLLERCLLFLIISGLLGVTTAGYAFARTRDRRYWLPCVASFIVLILGSMALWDAIN